MLLVLASPLWAQNKKELEQRKQKLQREIDETNKQLRETSKNKNLTAAQVAALKKKIRLRQEMIATITREMDGLVTEINTTGSEIMSLEKIGRAHV